MSRERPILFSGPMVRAILDGRKTQMRHFLKRQPFKSECVVGYVPYRRGRRWGMHFHNPNHTPSKRFEFLSDGVVELSGIQCPFGVPGDRLWVKEASWIGDPYAFDPHETDIRDSEGRRRAVGYSASMNSDSVECAKEFGVRQTSARFMPRWASRLTLEVTGVRVERVQEISEFSARAEGIRLVTKDGSVEKFCVYDLGDYSSMPWAEMPRTAVDAYRSLWNALNEKRGFGWDANPWVWVVEFRRAEA